MTASAKILALAPVVRKRHREHRLHHTKDSKAMLKRFAGALRGERERRGLSRPELARLVGVSVSRIVHLELAENYPTLPVYDKLCEVLGLGERPLLK